jgi:hypothetical protein
VIQILEEDHAAISALGEIGGGKAARRGVVYAHQRQSAGGFGNAGADDWHAHAAESRAHFRVHHVAHDRIRLPRAHAGPDARQGGKLSDFPVLHGRRVVREPENQAALPSALRVLDDRDPFHFAFRPHRWGNWAGMDKRALPC